MNVETASPEDIDGFLSLAAEVENWFGPMIADPQFHTAGPRPRRAEGDGGVLRVRHLRTGPDRPTGGAVAVLRLPRRREGAERRRNVARPHVDVPRHLPRARHRRRAAHRGAG